MSNIHDNIRRFRQMRGWSQDELAKRSGYGNRSSIARVEQGDVDIPQSRIVQLARALGVSEAELIGVPEKAQKDIRPLPEFQKLEGIPILGPSACGSPILADRVYDYVRLDKPLKADFALIARGRSMTGCGIMNGSLVLFQETPEVQNGDIAAVLVDDSTTIKKFYKYGDTVVLKPCNPEFEEMEFSGEQLEKVRVFGKAICSLIEY